MSKNFAFSVLLDFYGEMLTDKQREAIEYYYNNDLSLSEIAYNQGISRQGVRDAVKRAESLLYNMEDRLGLVRRFYKMQEGLEIILGEVKKIEKYNDNTIMSKEICEYIEKIKEVVGKLCE